MASRLIAGAMGLFACQGSQSVPKRSLVAASATLPPSGTTFASAAPAPRASVAPPPTTGSSTSAGTAWPPPPPEGIRTDFCIELVSALDEESCYVLPSARTDELLLYLHGTLPPTKTSLQKTHFQTVVATASRRANVAALIPRGRQGLGAKGQQSWWAWPTSADAHGRLVRDLVLSMVEKRRKLEALTGAPFSRVYLAGSSSGAYFVTALALSGTFEAEAYAAISGGSASRLEKLEHLPPKPFYVGYGRHDPVGSAATSLGERLRKAGWPVKLAVHPLPHGTSEVYLDEAFAFWREHRQTAAP